MKKERQPEVKRKNMVLHPSTNAPEVGAIRLCPDYGFLFLFLYPFVYLHHKELKKTDEKAYIVYLYCIPCIKFHAFRILQFPLNNKISSSCNGGASRHLTLGHAQKWISMAMKYFYCSDLFDFNFDYCYCPIDNIIIEKALGKQSESGKPKNLKGLVKPISWSKIGRISVLRDIYSDIDAIIEQNNLNCTQLEFDVLNWQ